MPDETQQPQDNDAEDYSADVISEDTLSSSIEDSTSQEDVTVSVDVEIDTIPEDSEEIPINVVEIVEAPSEPEEDKDILDTTTDSMDSLQERIARALAETDDTIDSEPLSQTEQAPDDAIADITETTASSYPAPAEPEWKRVAREMQEERAQQQRELLDAQKERSKNVFERRKAEKEQMRKEREAYEAKNRPNWRQKDVETEEAVQQKIEQLRQKRAQKLDDFADDAESVTGRRFTYPKPEPRTINYPSPSKMKRMESEQPISQEIAKEDEQPSPKPASKAEDITSRISRLAKPDAPAEPEPPSDDDSTGEG